MRRKEFYLGLYVLVISLVFVGCVMAPRAVPGELIPSASDYLLFDSKGNVSDVSPEALIPVPTKDFLTRGVIFITSSVTLDTNGYIIDGSKITFEMLMREVQKLNADDFINLRIDEIHTVTTTEGTVKRLVTSTQTGQQREVETRTIITTPSQIEYKATAVAIKYLPLE